MRLIYLVMLALLVSPILLAPTAIAASDDEDEEEDVEEGDEEGITSLEFSFKVGEGVEIGDYRVELISVLSVVDGLIEVRVWKRISEFEEWRVMEDHRETDFDEGAEEGGLSLTVTQILDDETVRMMAEYRSNYGYPQKYVTERAMAPKNLPKLEVSMTVDRADISVGDEVKVTTTVTNVGNDTAQDVEIQDSPPLPQFRYVIGYPPKIKNALEPGESDVAVYSMVAAAEGEVEIPATLARYTDSKSTIYSQSSQPISLEIKTERKPDLVLLVDSPDSIRHGGWGRINVTVQNQGDASAYKVDVKGELGSAGDGIEIVRGSLDESFFEIPPGGSESYSAVIRGSRSGSYTIDLEASFLGDGDVMRTETAFGVDVLEREYKFLYYLPIVPVIIIVFWLFKRYREYKY